MSVSFKGQVSIAFTSPYLNAVENNYNLSKSSKVSLLEGNDRDTISITNGRKTTQIDSLPKKISSILLENLEKAKFTKDHKFFTIKIDNVNDKFEFEVDE